MVLPWGKLTFTYTQMDLRENRYSGFDILVLHRGTVPPWFVLHGGTVPLSKQPPKNNLVRNGNGDFDCQACQPISISQILLKICRLTLNRNYVFIFKY